MTNPNGYPTYPTAPKKKGWLRKSWPFALTAVVGIAIGAAGGAGAGADTAAPEVAGVDEPVAPKQEKTKTVEVQVTDPLCAEVAQELFDIVEIQNNEVGLPMMEISQSLFDQLGYGIDAYTLEQDTEKLNGVSATLEGISDRIIEVGPDYLECTE